MQFETHGTLRKTPRQERAKATVEVLLEATSQVLVDRGYANLTTTRVAHRAGVSVGTLYQYFADKAELVRALHRVRIERAFGAFASQAQQQGDVSIDARLEGMLHALLEVKLERPALLTALHAAMLELDGPAYFRNMIAQTQGLVREVFEDYREDLPGVDLDLAAFILTNAVDGVMGAAVVTGKLDDPQLINGLTRLAMGYLRPGIS